MDQNLIFQALIVLGLLTIVFELIQGAPTGFDLVLIGIAFIVGGLVGFLTGNLALTLITISILSIAYIIFGRKIVKQQVMVLTHKTNIDKVIGKKGLVIRSITPDTPGMIRVDDEDWRAQADETLFEKDYVKIVAIEGVTLQVKKFNNK